MFLQDQEKIGQSLKLNRVSEYKVTSNSICCRSRKRYCTIEHITEADLKTKEKCDSF